LWFGKIERDLIARGVSTSVNDLACKIRCYIKAIPPMPNLSNGSTQTPIAASERIRGLIRQGSRAHELIVSNLGPR